LKEEESLDFLPYLLAHIEEVENGIEIFRGCRAMSIHSDRPKVRIRNICVNRNPGVPVDAVPD
jgi:hypothetical protein